MLNHWATERVLKVKYLFEIITKIDETENKYEFKCLNKITKQNK